MQCEYKYIAKVFSFFNLIFVLQCESIKDMQ